MRWRISLAFFASGLAVFAILYTVQPLFPVFVQQFHVTPAMASLSLSLSTISMAFSLPIIGAISGYIWAQ
ncbi:hypothetical protein NZD89_24435 [Alicyclobacillus fastidiosus]|uniref:MFS transporter n=1 Tax=Alicyclobacillus fastidiosus TaxID=392011 RepID=A0ABY6ZGM2_9BACL|nr:hypothetical protein [Alicyclobacillus fastidiosus]WAH41361.1 hypothetical protein NZD89_24435 [Alicyclobacillus fastidiosus]GMA62972.1 hypothetical protein GCM10025859_34120 [Alicyclobacillus fastidiosus]